MYIKKNKAQTDRQTEVDRGEEKNVTRNLRKKNKKIKVELSSLICW